MIRSEMMSYEEMKKKGGKFDSDYERICYRIEKVINNMKEEDGEVDMLSLDYAIDDIIWDCYEAEFSSSGFGLALGRSLMYYNHKNHMNYEIIYNDDYEVEEINIWECKEDYYNDEDDDDF